MHIHSCICNRIYIISASDSVVNLHARNNESSQCSLQIKYYGRAKQAVAQLVEALHHKTEGYGFDSLYRPFNPAEAVGFLGRKNPQHAFLRRGNKAVGPMS